MNLMCPARLILLLPGSRAHLAGEHIAEVYATPDAEEHAARLAEDVGARLTLLQRVESRVAGAEILVREIADAHRGETVVVIAPGLDLGLELPAVIEHEGDGWVVVPTPGAAG